MWHIIGRKLDYAFRRYSLHLLNSYHYSKLYIVAGLRFSEISYIVVQTFNPRIIFAWHCILKIHYERTRTLVKLPRESKKVYAFGGLLNKKYEADIQKQRIIYQSKA